MADLPDDPHLLMLLAAQEVEAVRPATDGDEVRDETSARAWLELQILDLCELCLRFGYSRTATHLTGTLVHLAEDALAPVTLPQPALILPFHRRQSPA